MRGQQINRVTGRVVIVVALTQALLAVLSGTLSRRSRPSRRRHGGTYLSAVNIAALVPMILLFLATADWKQPFAKRATSGISSAAALVFRVWSAVLP